MTIVRVTSYKGGAEKGTTVFHRAASFSDFGRMVLVDGDLSRTDIKGAGRSSELLPFTVTDERQTIKIISDHKAVTLDPLMRLGSDNLKELANCRNHCGLKRKVWRASITESQKPKFPVETELWRPGVCMAQALPRSNNPTKICGRAMSGIKKMALPGCLP